MLNIQDELEKLNIPFNNWCSDIYVQVNEQTTSLINRYEYKCHVTMFIDQITGKLSYEIPFSYTNKEVKQ